MSVCVVIPWRATDCPHRLRALEFVTARYAQEYPGWQVAVGEHNGGPWCKAAAVDAALAQTQAEILIVADADCWVDGLAEAVAAVSTAAPWAVPHRGVRRLTVESTARYMAGEPWEMLELDERAYLGVEGGGVTVLHRNVYEMVPLDPRFLNWGSEDESWGWAMRCLVGHPVRLKYPLIHLWHPPQERARRHMGSLQNWDLRKRYARARDREHVMRHLIEEAKSCSVLS